LRIVPRPEQRRTSDRLKSQVHVSRRIAVRRGLESATISCRAACGKAKTRTPTIDTADVEQLLAWASAACVLAKRSPSGVPVKRKSALPFLLVNCLFLTTDGCQRYLLYVSGACPQRRVPEFSHGLARGGRRWSVPSRTE
jgi:hypothetical protein